MATPKSRNMKALQSYRNQTTNTGMVFSTHNQLPTDTDISTHIPPEKHMETYLLFRMCNTYGCKERGCSGVWRRVREVELVGEKNLIEEQISHHSLEHKTRTMMPLLYVRACIAGHLVEDLQVFQRHFNSLPSSYAAHRQP